MAAVGAPSPDERLRGIRKRIWRMMVELPYRVASSVSIAAVPVGRFMGRARVLDEDVEAEARVYHAATGQPISPAVPAPWTPVPVTDADIDEMLSFVAKLKTLKTAIIRIVTGDGREYRARPQIWGEWCHVFAEGTDSAVEHAVPAQYPLDTPAEIRAMGIMSWYAWSAIAGVSLSLRVYAGTVGYRSGGSWVQWEGIVLHVDAFNVEDVGGITVYTPWGTLREDATTRYALMRTPFAYVKIINPEQLLC